MAGKTDNSGWTNLHHAVAERFTNLVHSLLEQGEETVNMIDVHGRTPLHLACSSIEGKEVPLYLKCESKDMPTRTLNETESIIELLLSHGGNSQVLDRAGKSPFHCLIDHWLTKKYPLDKIGKKIITQFLQCGADINRKDGNGRTPLHYLAGSPEMKVPIAKRDSEVSELVRRRRALELLNAPAPSSGTKAKESNPAKSTPDNQLYMKEFLAYILSCGADINAADHEGNTPLHLAIVAKKFDIVKDLLLKRPNVNAKNNEGQTPLHHAVSDKDKFDSCAILLLHKGALANIKDVGGRTPVDIARDRQDFPCFLKHLILLIDVKMHPEYDIDTGKTQTYERIKQEFKRQCEDLNTYFELNGKSQLPLILQSHSFPVYTENEFFQNNLQRNGFDKRFPDYACFIRYKFTQDQIRRKMIENCTRIFSRFGGQFQFLTNGRLVYKRHSHWENLPEELKLHILSYLNNDELEFLEKHLQ